MGDLWRKRRGQSRDTRPSVIWLPTDGRRPDTERNAVFRSASGQVRSRVERPGGLSQVQVENQAAQTQADPSVLAEQRAVVSGRAEFGHEETDRGPALLGAGGRNQTARTNISQDKKALSRLRPDRR